MKRVLSILMCIVLVFSLCACEGNFAQVDLQSDIPIPENGIIEKSVLNKIKEDNAIATFTGKSNAFSYEWTVFGSDIAEAKDVNFLIDVKNEKGIKIAFSQKEDFGFPALLSVNLNEKWQCQSATAYVDNKPVYSVSITGSKTSILNISINKSVDFCVVLPDEEKVQNSNGTSTTSKADNSKTNDSENNNSQNKSDSTNNDKYLSDSKGNNDNVYSENADESINENRVYSDGNDTEQDKYLTDPVPQGKPMPVEPENQEINDEKTYTCTFSIECSTILNNLEDLNSDKRELVPSNGVILPSTTVAFKEGESVFDVLQRVCKENNIHLESSWTPIYNSAYIEGIHNLYEFDCGDLSGWTYRVNGWYPNYGCSRYQLTQGEVVEWRYTCDLGKDVGCDWMA